MGTEYQIRATASPDRARVDLLLRSHPRFAELDAQHAFYNFRDPRNTGAMPDVSIGFEGDVTLYVCDHGNVELAGTLIGALVIHLVRDGGAAEVRQLE